MARTPLAGAAQEAVAAIGDDERRTTRARFVKEAGVGALGLAALGRFAAPARGAGSAEDRRRRRRPRRPDARRTALKQAGLRGARSTRPRPDRRPLLDAARRLRRRADRRARRRADRPGTYRDPAARAGARADARQPARRPSRTAPRPRLVRRRAVPYAEMTDDLKGDLAEDPQRPLGRELPDALRLVTQRGRQLDHMSIIDWIKETVPPAGSSSRLGQLLDVAYNIEYGAESSVQSSLNLLYLLGYAGQGQLRIFGKSNEKYHVRGRQRPDHRPARGGSARARSRLGSELVAIKPNAGGLLHAHASGKGSATTTVTADKVVLALPVLDPARARSTSPKAGFEPLKLIAIRELGMGTNSKLHVQFSSRFWNALGSQRRDLLRHRLPEHLGGLARAAGHDRASSSTTRAARSARASARGTPTSRAQQFLAQIEPRAARRDPGLERPGDDRLLDRLPVDEGLVLVLEGRPVHERSPGWRAVGRATATSAASTRRSIPGLPERRRRDRSARSRRDPGRLQVVTRFRRRRF